LLRGDVIRRLNSILTHPKATSYDQPIEIRSLEEPPDKYRNVFAVDVHRIKRSKAFRRLKHKTQIFWAPRNAHFRTRMTHTIEVADNARTIAINIGLNPDLTEAIALGHDIGHPPFGHAGERALKSYIAENFPGKEFNHHKESVHILQQQEKIFIGDQVHRGLNLTSQVENGIRYCSTESKIRPETLEGQLVAITDDITYVIHDFEEFREVKIQIPDKLIEDIYKLGRTGDERLNQIIQDIIENTDEKEVKISEDLHTLIKDIVTQEAEIFTYHHLWRRREEGSKVIIYKLMDYFMHQPLETIEEVIRGLTRLPQDPISAIDRIRDGEMEREDAFINYMARMTDTFALDLYRFIYSPETLDYYY